MSWIKHFGRQLSGVTRIRTWRHGKSWTIPLMMMLWTWSSPAGAQVVSDTIVIDILGNPTEVLLTAEYVTPARVGDSVIFRANVVDEDGDPTPALVTFVSEDSTALIFESVTPSGMADSYHEALGIALRKATVKVWVIVEPIDEVLVASFRDGVLGPWGGPDSIAVGESLPYCAYALHMGNFVAKQIADPPCPDVFQRNEPPAGPYRALSRVVQRELPLLGFNHTVRPVVRRADGDDQIR